MKRIALLALALATLPCRAGEWDDSVDKAVGFLRKTQEKSGAWDAKTSPGLTGVIVTGLVRTGKLKAGDAMLDAALKYIEGQIDEKAGHIAGTAKEGHRNYVTSVNVIALAAAGRPVHKAAVKKASEYLRKLQWDEGEMKGKEDDYYGGAGYDSKSRPDLSNTQLFLDALAAAGVPKDDEAFKKAIVFVTRCQNLKGEGNDQPWAGKIDDGSFIYTAALGGDTKVSDKPDPEKGLPGYGSMTYAGVKSLLHCGLPKSDKRVAKALEWLGKNYTVDVNPGMPEARARMGLYYYYMTMAKCLEAVGDDALADAKGKKRDWRGDLTRKLAKLQAEDGSWSNTNDRWLEKNKHLATGYALIALGATKPK
ncbi:MAG: terpene cyclase/mutase family protein [Gemmataceae bacterium]|nr:terpene cyclase/mutase family protein [Gemmataceae bacterium]